MRVNVVVAAINASGESDLVPFVVICSPGEVADNEHLEVAKAAAHDEGYREPMIAFEERTDRHGLFSLFSFRGDDAPTIMIHEEMIHAPQ